MEMIIYSTNILTRRCKAWSLTLSSVQHKIQFRKKDRSLVFVRRNCPSETSELNLERSSEYANNDCDSQNSHPNPSCLWANVHQTLEKCSEPFIVYYLFSIFL